VLIEIARLADPETQAAVWERVKAGGTVRDARRAKPRATPAPATQADERLKIRRESDRLLRRLEGVTARALREDGELMAQLRDLHRRLDRVLADD
jgi:hypothetical protein